MVIDKDLEKAVEWHAKAVKQGLPEAQYYLAKCYEEGKGAKKNLSKAKKWYAKAAEQGVKNVQIVGKENSNVKNFF